MQINAGMRKLLIGLPTMTGGLNVDLSNIAKAGFEVEEDCYLLKSLLPKIGATRIDFPDCTGYEFFVNSVHIEDYDQENTLVQALSFIARVFEVWSEVSTNLLVSVVSADDISVVVKFHCYRANKNWLSDNIHGYVNPIMSIESTESIISATLAARNQALTIPQDLSSSTYRKTRNQWINEVIIRAQESPNTYSSFAAFVRFVEQAGPISGENFNAETYERAWFQLEILNALALDAWETDGKPADWTENWYANYRTDAVELITEFLNVIKSM